jgi:hypothetical protein
MKRLLLIASMAGLLAGTTGCLAPHCRSCSSSCPSGSQGGGLFGKLHGVPLGCRPAPMRWQQGGTDYAHGLALGRPTIQGHGPGHAGPYGMERGPAHGGHHVGPVRGALHHAGAALHHGGPHGAGMHGGGFGAGMHGGGFGAGAAQQQFAPGPPTGTVAYPYYTVRGPRDFLLDNPPSIGY